jgi:hypothetical protein
MHNSRAALVEDIVRVRDNQNIRLEALGTGPTLEQQRAMQLLAREHRQLFADLELNLPQPGAQDRPRDYRVELLRRLQKFSRHFGETDLRRVAAAGGLSGIDKQIVADAHRMASDKTIGSFRRQGALREIRRTDQSGQVTEVSFAGDPLSWMSAFMPATKTMVENFNTRRR